MRFKIFSFDIKPDNGPFRWLSWVLIIAILNLTAACNSYKVVSPETTDDTYHKLRLDKRYFVLHFGEEAYHLEISEVSEADRTISGTIEELPAERKSYLNTHPDKKIKHPKNSEEVFPVDETHIYVRGYTTEGNLVVINFFQIEKVEQYKKNTTTMEVIVATLGILLFLAAILFYVEGDNIAFG